MKPASLVLTKFLRKKVLPYSPIKQQPKLDTERRLRGKEDYQKLLLSDAVIVSYEKSGRTWLRVMLSRFYQQRHKLPESKLLNFDRLNRLEPNVPVVFFTHDKFLRYYTGTEDNTRLYAHAPLILLVRDPRDVAVSFYFDWKYRMDDHYRGLLHLPTRDLPIYDFIMGEHYGLTSVINFMNQWFARQAQLPNAHLFLYEDLRTDTINKLNIILQILGAKPTLQEVEEIVAYAEFEKMKQREQAGTTSDSRISAADPLNPNSYKARRAKVGGYRDYFSEEQIREIDALVADTLNPGYGY